jgi:predicted small secreted protein
MNKKITVLSVLLVLSFILASCNTGVNATGVQSTAAAVSGTSLKEKLGSGILNLENTDLAVTSSQAEELLVLWRGVSAIGTKQITAQQEIDALYEQIQESLTAEQLAAIEKMTQEDVSAVVSKYGSSASTQAQPAASSSSSKSSSQAQMGGGGMPPDMGGGGGDMMTMGGGGDMGGTTQTKTEQASAAPSQAQSSGSDANVVLAEAIINLLKGRVTNA